eukprot:358951-Chlamydomonas_euryale.AAC.12
MPFPLSGKVDGRQLSLRVRPTSHSTAGPSSAFVAIAAAKRRAQAAPRQSKRALENTGSVVGCARGVCSVRSVFARSSLWLPGRRWRTAGLEWGSAEGAATHLAGGHVAARWTRRHSQGSSIAAAQTVHAAQRSVWAPLPQRTPTFQAPDALLRGRPLAAPPSGRGFQPSSDPQHVPPAQQISPSTQPPRPAPPLPAHMCDSPLRALLFLSSPSGCARRRHS